MAATTTPARVKKALANPEPSTHGAKRQFIALQRPHPLSRVMRTYQGRRWRGPKKAIMAVAVIHTRTERQGTSALC